MTVICLHARLPYVTKAAEIWKKKKQHLWFLGYIMLHFHCFWIYRYIRTPLQYFRLYALYLTFLLLDTCILLENMISQLHWLWSYRAPHPLLLSYGWFKWYLHCFRKPNISILHNDQRAQLILLYNIIYIFFFYYDLTKTRLMHPTKACLFRVLTMCQW